MTPDPELFQILESIAALRAETAALWEALNGLKLLIDRQNAGGDLSATRLAAAETRLAVFRSVVEGKIEGLREEIQGLTRWLI